MAGAIFPGRRKVFLLLRSCPRRRQRRDSGRCQGRLQRITRKFNFYFACGGGCAFSRSDRGHPRRRGLSRHPSGPGFCRQEFCRVYARCADPLRARHPSAFARISRKPLLHGGMGERHGWRSARSLPRRCVNLRWLTRARKDLFPAGSTPKNPLK